MPFNPSNPIAGSGGQLLVNDDGTYYEFLVGTTKVLQVAKTGGHLEVAGDVKARKTL